ncbi:Aldo/keto reductase [Polychaeton citri CBS 116435]|uniref:Aldo/keto reductase n=1 Tax=Polychaeton citri CBS 116435 TaxID=1314669 RepID=A0A9P4PZY4_9PEZI|nr:Aldo/keto reductase [Polychaeton citri CBS 116435]
MASLTLQSTLKLLPGTQLPVLGFGVWDSPSHLTTKSCLEALKVGYRHIDTAQVYGNEAEVGEAIQQGGISRKDIFVTSKILNPGTDAESTYRKCIDSVNKISGPDGYLDLMLIHNVSSGRDGIKLIWQALERCHQEGKIKALGVSNFGTGHIENLKSYAKVPPSVNQLELHPWTQQREIVEYCQKNGITVEAYCPLVRNQKKDDPTLVAIAKKHNKSTAQVLIRYCLEKAWAPLPKSDNPGRIAQNADVFDFKLDKNDMEELDMQDQGSAGALVMVAENKAP